MSLTSGLLYAPRISRRAVCIWPTSTQHLGVVHLAARDTCKAQVNTHMQPLRISLTPARLDSFASLLSTWPCPTSVDNYLRRTENLTFEIAKLILEQDSLVARGQLREKREDDGGLPCAQKASEDGDRDGVGHVKCYVSMNLDRLLDCHVEHHHFHARGIPSAPQRQPQRGLGRPSSHYSCFYRLCLGPHNWLLLALQENCQKWRRRLPSRVVSIRICNVSARFVFPCRS